jgi:Domain of unknown function (DUF5680)
VNPNESPDLVSFIVRAKTATWNADGSASLSYRPGSRDLQYHEPGLAYLDSYFGGTDFLGQEVVWVAGVATWAMNYHGRVLRPDLYDGARAGATSKAGRGRVYDKNTFLGHYAFECERSMVEGATFQMTTFHMTTTGDHTAFSGSEWHELEDTEVYRFDFHGGSITT